MATSADFVTPLGAIAPVASSAAPTMSKVNPYDASAAQRTPQLPLLSSLPAGAGGPLGSVIISKSDVSTNPVIVSCGGSDTFDDGRTAHTLRRVGEQLHLQAVAIGGTRFWRVIGGWDPQAVSSVGVIPPGVRGGRREIVRRRDFPRNVDRVYSGDHGPIRFAFTNDVAAVTQLVGGAIMASMPNPTKFTPGGGDTLTVDGTSRAFFNWQWNPGPVGGNPASSFPNPRGWFVQHGLDGASELEYLVYTANNTTAFFNLMIDGRWVWRIPRVPSPALTGVRYASIRFHNLPTGRHDIRFYMSNASLFRINANAGANIWAKPLTGPRVMFVGDSFTEGGGQATGVQLGSFLWRFAHMAGFEDVWNAGVGGTGYYAVGTSSATFGDRIVRDIVPNNPDVVFLTGYYNDLSQSGASIASALNAALTNLRAAPSNPMVVVTGAWDPDPALARTKFAEFDAAMKPVCVAHNVPFIEPRTGSAYDGAGNVVLDGATTAGPWITTANKARYIGADSVHYSDAGSVYIAHRMFAAYSALIPA